MVRRLRIYKERETESEAVYRFGFTNRQMGRLLVRKADGFVEQVMPAPHPLSRALFARAMYRVLDHWTRGELPDLTYWDFDEQVEPIV